MANFFERWQRQRKLKKLRRKGSRLWKTVRWGWRLLILLFVIDVFYIMLIWPDWDAFKQGSIPKSRFIRDYETQMNEQLYRGGLSWQPVPLRLIPKHLQRAVIAAEDARFYQHNGFDVIAFTEAMDTNLELMQFKYGASTISQQTIKNLFLTSSRNPLRKWHELILTLGMEWNLDKARILETYLNIAEFGEGIYGVEAAAKHYYHQPAIALNAKQSAELAATLPSPIKHNPDTRTKRFLKRSRRIYRWMQMQASD
jgi:monofunctional biosynthetic peptidoglycan transglycosylase